MEDSGPLVEVESLDKTGVVVRPTKSFPGLTEDFDLCLSLSFLSETNNEPCAAWKTTDGADVPLSSGTMTRAQLGLFAKHILLQAVSTREVPFLLSAFELWSAVVDRSSMGKANLEIEEFRLQLLW
uniref:Uncharacterized protein n=1 Tax=Chromera velia CCMP2878 TaxID=1169474 RepID=A0A0G4GDB3_9ALVE|eukprot:Cvel_616.t1-p1 / transcript=Cvel_616.t1 / gene=Cvel_616 / organism=Chromera_velia_CCMP2878 / gene_product=hypothetical protein / transcript_product=hypothetical protein / location=Cvel_scaffold19:30953-31327(-) / protein_length=125 / sequence_SO=supercontig / SO=protein_coding / is_pseudo=false